jgi:adenine deaminase
VERLLDAENVAALGEVMDIPGLVNGAEGVHAKIRAARERDLTVDGHMPRVRGRELQEAARYLDNDHESISLDEAREKVEAGLRVYLRQGSSSKNLVDLVPLADEVDTRRLSLCTDDREVVDIVERGGLDYALKMAMDAGMDPVTAVQLGTLNTAESYELPFGRLQPGAPADLVLLSDLEQWEVQDVLIDGVLNPTADTDEPPASQIARDTVHFESVAPAELGHPAPADSDPGDAVSVRVIDAVGGLQTELMEATVPVEDGRLVGDGDQDILPLAVIERHGNDAGIGTGFVHQLGLDRGAIGSTVAHDAHNLVVAGADHESMARVANHIRDIEGGIAAYDPTDDEMTSLALPVAGLMSDRPIQTVSTEFHGVETAAEAIGLDHAGGLMELSFLPLEVIPEVRLTNNGLVDVSKMDYVDVLAG